MKKSVGVILALVVTVLTIGAAFTVQHFVSADQAVERQAQSSQTSSSTQATTSASSSMAHVRSTQASQSTTTKRVKPKHQATARRQHHQAAASAHSQSRRTSAVKKRQSAQSTRSSQTARTSRAATTTTKATATKSTPKAVKSTTTAESVHLVVTGYHKTFFDGRVKINAKSTAFSVLKASKLKLVYQGGVAFYVSSINGLAQNDIKTGSGWKYKVNGKFIDRAANQTKVGKNDSVHWYFTTKGY